MEWWSLWAWNGEIFSCFRVILRLVIEKKLCPLMTIVLTFLFFPSLLHHLTFVIAFAFENFVSFFNSWIVIKVLHPISWEYWTGLKKWREKWFFFICWSNQWLIIQNFFLHSNFKFLCFSRKSLLKNLRLIFNVFFFSLAFCKIESRTCIVLEQFEL